jgi:hypothetical protein
MAPDTLPHVRQTASRHAELRTTQQRPVLLMGTGPAPTRAVAGGRPAQ